MTIESDTNETIEAGNAITVSGDQVSIHPDLATTLNGVILNELTQHSFTHNVVSCISKTIIFPVVPKKGARKNKHYHLIGLIPFFAMMERKGHKEFMVSIVDEPTSPELIIGNAYQLGAVKRSLIESAILAAVLEVVNNSPEAKSSNMNFVECEAGNGNFDPMVTAAGFKKGARTIKAFKEVCLPEPVIELLKVLGIDLEEEGDQHERKSLIQDD